MVLLAIFRREYRPVVLLAFVVFGAWHIYQASTHVEYGVRYLSSFLRDFRDLTQAEDMKPLAQPQAGLSPAIPNY